MILPVIRWWTETVKYFGFLYNQCVYFKRKKVAHNLLRLHSSEKWYCMWFLATEDNAALFRLRMLSSCKCMSGTRNWLFRKTKAYRNHYMTTQCVTSICVHNIFHLYSWLSNMYKIGFCFNRLLFVSERNIIVCCPPGVWECILYLVFWLGFLGVSVGTHSWRIFQMGYEKKSHGRKRH